MTITELLQQWKNRKIALDAMAKVNYGADSPEKNKMIIIMSNQLGHCINDLDELMNADPLRRAMTKAVSARVERERNDKSR